MRGWAIAVGAGGTVLLKGQAGLGPHLCMGLPASGTHSGVKQKGLLEEGKDSQSSVLRAILVKKNLIRGDNGDFVCVLTFSSLFPTPPPSLCPSFVISMGKLGNVIITENIVGPWKLGGGAPCPGVQEALFKKKKNFFFF